MRFIIQFFKDGYVPIRLYMIYCTILAIYIIHEAVIGPQTTMIRSSTLIQKLHSSEEQDIANSRSVILCDYYHLIIPSINVETNKSGHTKSYDKDLVIIGHDKMNNVQTNNKLNAILHAMDYASDINATLALTRNGWSTKTLRQLFSYNYQTNKDWERSIEFNLNIKFVDNGDYNHNHKGYNIYFNHSNDMYYYHTNASIETIKLRREPILRYLWTHPTISSSQFATNNMCIVSKNIHPAATLPTITPFTVIHSRWMKNNGCLNRLGALAHRIKNTTGISIDRKAPCLLEAEYIESILSRSGMIGKPIYIISDGLNSQIIQRLKSDPSIGKYIKLPPKDVSWVGGDMMLGVLSDCFIGTPISTLSGNIARARIALGKHPSTNFMFPFKKERKDDRWDFACQADSDCLYDVKVLSHYVG